MPLLPTSAGLHIPFTSDEPLDEGIQIFTAKPIAPIEFDDGNVAAGHVLVQGRAADVEMLSGFFSGQKLRLILHDFQ